MFLLMENIFSQLLLVKKGLVRLKQGLEITEILLDAIDMDVPIIATFR